MSKWEITPAQSEDLPALATLLKSCGLPDEDITPALLADFLVCRDGGRLLAVAGVEPCGESALLRSVAVLPECRRHGLANHLLEALERHAATREHREMYLLTTAAAEFFARRGFRPVARERVPAAVAATAEFSRLCPASAVCMHKTLSGRILP